jgi:TIR domain
MIKLYLSHSIEDNIAAKRLERVLTDRALSRGNRITFLGLSLSVWGNWAQEIEKCLAESNCVILLWSVNASQSRWVAEEASYALEDRKLIICTLDETPIPPRFSDIIPIKLHQLGTEQGIVLLEKVIDRLQLASE